MLAKAKRENITRFEPSQQAEQEYCQMIWDSTSETPYALCRDHFC